MGRGIGVASGDIYREGASGCGHAGEVSSRGEGKTIWQAGGGPGVRRETAESIELGRYRGH